MRSLALTLLLTAAATDFTGQEAATGAFPCGARNAIGDATVKGGLAPTHGPVGLRETSSSNVIVLDDAVDEEPDAAAFANLVRVYVVGCDDLRDQNCARLTHFRFEYGWESAQQLQTRLNASRPDLGGRLDSGAGRASIGWVRFQTDDLGRAGLPLPNDVSGANVLHVRLKEPGWGWFTFPGAIHPGTLDGAAAFEVQSGSRHLRLTLMRGATAQ